MRIALAFSAGLLATVNPCGFAMLPAYLSWFVGARDSGDARGVGARAAQGVLVGGLVTAGFLAVFGTAGVLIAIGLRSFVKLVPWVALAIGVILVVVGVRGLAGRPLALRLPAAVGPVTKGGYRNVLVFGLAYAVASLSCTIQIFLAVVGTSLTGGAAQAILVFAFYALGVAAVLMGISISVAIAKGGLVSMIRKMLPAVERIAAALMVIAGVFIVFYWSVNLADADPDSPLRAPIHVLERAQSAISVWLAGGGGTAVALAVLGIAGFIWAWFYWKRTARAPR